MRPSLMWHLSLKQHGRCGVYHCSLKANPTHLLISISHLLYIFLIVLLTFCVVPMLQSQYDLSP